MQLLYEHLTVLIMQHYTYITKIKTRASYYVNTNLLERKCRIESNFSLVEYEAATPESLAHMCRISGSNFNLKGTLEGEDLI